MTILPSKKISVIVPNYNYGRYINRRIDSIVRQTYPIHELIVLDDCSSDRSVETIEKKIIKVRKKYPNLKIRFVKNQKNSGKAMMQWKKGWELATGDYIWIAEADDLCSRNFLTEIMKGFNDPTVVLSYAESAVINGWGLMIAPNFRWSRDKEKTGHFTHNYVKDGRDEIQEIMAIRCTIPNVSGVVFKKDQRVLKFLEESLRFSQVGDWYLYAKILEDGKVSYNQKSLNMFRIHQKSKTNRTKNDEKHFDEIVEMHRYFEDNYDLSEKVLEWMKDERKRVKERMRVAHS